MLDELDRDFEAETGFGTGLRRHLRAQFDEEPTLVEAEEAPPEPVAEEPDPHQIALEQLVLQLERREQEVVLREQSLAVREQALAQEAKRIAEERADLEQHLDVRELLRARAELEAERLWRTFDDALEATGANGAPDYQTRLNAARALLAEAYAGGAEPAAPSLPDQLAELRERKVV